MTDSDAYLQKNMLSYVVRMHQLKQATFSEDMVSPKYLHKYIDLMKQAIYRLSNGNKLLKIQSINATKSQVC